MDALQTLLVAILQGATELFPVSSLGHAVIVPSLLHWQLNQHDPSFLPFLVLLHTGTSVALLLYFWRDWWAMASGVLGIAGATATRTSRRLLVRIIVATIPAVIFGFAFNKFFHDLFDSPLIACGFLIVNGVLLIACEKLRSGRSVASGQRGIEDLTIGDAVAVGFWQCGALFPGISRSGATIVGGLLRGVDHGAAAHFSFLIALPVIVGATVLEVPKLMHAPLPPGVLNLALTAAVVAGVTAFLSTWFLMKYFRNHDKWALNPFGIYCIIAGAGSLAWLVFVG